MTLKHYFHLRGFLLLILAVMASPFGTRMVAQAQAPPAVDAILYADLDFDQVETSPARTLFLRHRRPSEYTELTEPLLEARDA